MYLPVNICRSLFPPREKFWASNRERHPEIPSLRRLILKDEFWTQDPYPHNMEEITLRNNLINF